MFTNFISRIPLFGLSVLLAAPLAAQQVEVPEEPDPEAKAAAEAQGFRLPPQLRRVDYRDANPWVLHANVRYSQTESAVQFGGLGAIPSSRNIPGADQTDFALRQYDDGGVALDSPRTDETDANGNQTSTPGGRYQVTNDDGDIIGDYLAYTPGQTRDWAFLDDSQIVNGQLHLNTFSTESSGANFSRDAEGSGLGMEFGVSKRILKFGRKTDLSFSATVGISDFEARAADRITANLITLTDVYNVLGTPPAASYLAPDFELLFDDIGNEVPGDGREVTVPLQQLTPDRRITNTPNGANVEGVWEIKGAYYSIRLGPEIRSHITEKLAFTAGAGFLGVYVGSDFSVTETLDLDGYPTFRTIQVNDTENLTDLIAGFYAEATIEYWITQRTGFFVGATFESVDDFVQTFGGRTASVLLGDATVVRFGIIHRF